MNSRLWSVASEYELAVAMGNHARAAALYCPLQRLQQEQAVFQQWLDDPRAHVVARACALDEARALERAKMAEEDSLDLDRL